MSKSYYLLASQLLYNQLCTLNNCLAGSWNKLIFEMQFFSRGASARTRNARAGERASGGKDTPVGVGEFIHKCSSEGVNGCACKRTSETASAFPSPPSNRSSSILSLFLPSALFLLSLSFSYSSSRFLYYLPSTLRRDTVSFLSRIECNVRSVKILHSRCVLSLHFLDALREGLPLSI